MFAIAVTVFLLQAMDSNAQLGSSLEMFGALGETKDAPCEGIADEACKSDDDEIKKQCKKSLCMPLCLRLTWECKVHMIRNPIEYLHSFILLQQLSASGGPNPGFAKQVNDPAIQRALCAQFKAEGCANVLKCCDAEANFMYRWVEQVSSNN